MAKKVLILSESSNLASGFGTYAKEVISRLHSTGKYDIAEFASYGSPEAGKSVPWKFYSNTPTTDEQKKLYEQTQHNHFGVWRFDQVILHFKPDIVITYRDPWMDEWIRQSPLRRFFNWAWMPTVDSAPQKRRWLDTFATCDGIFAYSEYGVRVLEDEGGGLIPVIGCASPGIHPNIFKPVPNKAEHKKQLGLPEDSFIVGTVMRNQTRKLFIELIKSFRIFLDNAPKHIADKTYLYLHTSYPERSGWDIEGAIVEQQIAPKVLNTYRCKGCKSWKVSRYDGVITSCLKCGHRTSFMPNVSEGLEVEDLVKVYNIFDLYVQYAICEGFGMPQVEAAACGVPIAATNYSAMEDIVHHTKGFPISIDKMFRDMNTGADRAYPSNSHLAQIIEEFFSSTEEYRRTKSEQARQGAIRRYDWDNTAKIWENYIDLHRPTREQSQWNSPPSFVQVPDSMPDIQSHDDFVNWCAATMLHSSNSNEINGYQASKQAESLNYGCEVDNNLNPVTRESVFNSYKSRANRHNQAEQVRCGMVPLIDIDYLY